MSCKFDHGDRQLMGSVVFVGRIYASTSDIGGAVRTIVYGTEDIG